MRAIIQISLILPMLVAVWGCTETPQQKAAREQALVRERFAMERAEWEANPDLILSRWKAMLADQPRAVRGDIWRIRNGGVKDKRLDEFDALAERAELLKPTKNGTSEARLSAYRRLVERYPEDASYRREMVAMERTVQRDAAKVRVAEAKAQAAEARRRRSEGVSVGMSKRDVLGSSWGRPERINSTTTALGDSEQWVYGTGNYLYFSGDKLVSIQTRR